MGRALRQLAALTGPQQAAYFHSRERRRSLAGVLELFRTHVFAIPTASVAVAAFPDPNRDRPFTIRTAVQITGAAAAGLIFEFGDATTAMALFLSGGQVLTARAGDAGASDRALASWDFGDTFPDGMTLDIVVAVRPGDGRIRIWVGGNEVARATATNGKLDNGWAAASTGAFAAAAQGALPADVTETGAPSDFLVITPLSAYVGQVPRHFV